MLRYLRLPTRKIFSPQHFEFQIICCRFSVLLCLYKIKCFRAYQMPGLHSKEGRHSAAFAGWCMRRQLQSVRLGLNGWGGAAAQPASVSKVRSPNPNLEREKTLLLLYPKSVSVVWRWDQAATGWCWLVAPAAALAQPFKFSRIGCCLNCESRKWKIFMYLFTAFGRLELEYCERKIMLDWLELELVAGVVWEEITVALEESRPAEHSDYVPCQNYWHVETLALTWSKINLQAELSD